MCAELDWFHARSLILDVAIGYGHCDEFVFLSDARSMLFSLCSAAACGDIHGVLDRHFLREHAYAMYHIPYVMRPNMAHGTWDSSV